ncbi:MAG: lantibiotic dehydratase [Myxococcales bacterium]|nr:lantibiotic dehydratase [Myxococcales bacterium]
MRTRWKVGERCAVRAPLLPIETVADAGATGDATAETLAAQRAWLGALLDRADVAEAVWLASPALATELELWRRAPDTERGRAAECAAMRYVARMATRSTPFGLFAGIGVGHLGGRGATAVTLAPPSDTRRCTRLDNELLHRLTTAMIGDATVRAALTWSPNTSLTRVAGKTRYAEARLGAAGAGISYHLIAVDPTPHLDATLTRARGGARLGELAAALVDEVDGIELADGAAFVDELVAAQLLVPRLGVVVTGADPLAAVIAQLRTAGRERLAARMSEISRTLGAIDAAGVGGAATAYLELAGAVAQVFRALGDDTAVDPARVVQVDLGMAMTATIGRDIPAQIERTVEALCRITRRRPDEALSQFQTAFRQRWDEQEVPLAEVLDEEAGIGFAAATGPGSEGAPLLVGLPFTSPPGEARVLWGEREAWLLGQLAQLWARGEHELVLDEAALKALTVEAPAVMPAAWSAMVRIARDAAGRTSVLLDGASGPSGARLLGRFCHVDGEIDAMVRTHLAAEEALAPDAIHAEIVHLAEGRNGNVLCRPVLRSHELTYLGLSGAADAAQLTLEDLVVSVRGDRVVLRSRALDREVIPRLTSAHNVHARGLGTYRFLAALATQDGVGVGWSWGPLADAPRLPRVRIGDTVVARAQWTLTRAELDGVTTAARRDRAAGFAAMQAVRAARGLPRWVALIEGDNELVVDLDHALMVDAFVDALGRRPRTLVCEVYPALDAGVVDSAAGQHASEVVCTFVRDDGARVATAIAPPLRRDSGARRFAPGSRWLYAKLYGGVTTADRVLREAVAPVVRAALASGAARRWFFIRYADPQPHLRLRLDGAPDRLLAEVLPMLERATEPLLDDGSLCASSSTPTSARSSATAGRPRSTLARTCSGATPRRRCRSSRRSRATRATRRAGGWRCGASTGCSRRWGSTRPGARRCSRAGATRWSPSTARARRC